MRREIRTTKLEQVLCTLATLEQVWMYDQCQVIGTDIAQKIHCTENLNNKEKEGPVKQYQRIPKCYKVKRNMLM